MNDARDENQLRLSLSCEAGLNDGTTLPFLLLALLWHNAQGAVSAAFLWKWFSVDLLWPLFAGLVIIMGVTLAQHWNVQTILLALILFVLIRPTAVYLATWRSVISRQQRFGIGWLGIRGIVSLNYIAYAYGLHAQRDDLMIDIAITVIMLGVLVDGVTVKPLLKLRRS